MPTKQHAFLQFARGDKVAACRCSEQTGIEGIVNMPSEYTEIRINSSSELGANFRDAGIPQNYRAHNHLSPKVPGEIFPRTPVSIFVLHVLSSSLTSPGILPTVRVMSYELPAGDPLQSFPSGNKVSLLSVEIRGSQKGLVLQRGSTFPVTFFVSFSYDLCLSFDTISTPAQLDRTSCAGWHTLSLNSCVV